MTSISLAEAAERFGGTLLNPDANFFDLSIDSRSTKPDDLFVALKGSNYDGHSFISSIKNIICGAVVSEPNFSIDIPQWVVKDTSLALGQLAIMRRESFNGKVIAVTGSSGKTSVKESIYSILATRYRVSKTFKNLNNHLGVPLTIFKNDLDSDFWIVEMGASSVGEIEYLCKIAKPDFALINNIQRAHIEGFGSMANILKAKSEIYLNLPQNGVAIINLDEESSDYWLQLNSNRKCFTFSEHKVSADVHANNIFDYDDGCFEFHLNIRDKESSATIGKKVLIDLPGLHHVRNSLAAAAVGLSVGLDIDNICNGLKDATVPQGRFQIIDISNLLKVIDDSYNANPDSFKLAVGNLERRHGFNIVVIGDLAELGDQSCQIHNELGDFIKDSDINLLFSHGVMSRYTSISCGGRHFDKLKDLLSELSETISRNMDSNHVTNILVKGSRSSKMERVVKALLRSYQIPC